VTSRLTIVFWCSALCALLGCEAIAGIPKREGEGTAAQLGHAGAPASDACTQFCQQVGTSCTKQYAIYHGPEDCGAACKLLNAPELTCRAQEASAAAVTGDDYLHCPGTSLGGSKACGGNCTNYCRLMDRVCIGNNRDIMEVENCEERCNGLIDRESSKQPATTSRYDVNLDHEGDTLQCRLVHLTIASYHDPEDHCWHAWLAPRALKHADGSKEANPCATDKGTTEPRCEDYCQIAMNACTQEHQIYETPAQCLAVCQKLDKGSVIDEAPETVACRKIHAYNALAWGLPSMHCPHAGPGGDLVCGDDCTGYCRLLQAGCADAFATAHGGMGPDAMQRCTSTCAQRHGRDPLHYSVASAKGKTSNPVACGLLNAARALERPAEAAALCASAVGGGDCAR
jgi:hypothetical protein